MEHLFFFILYNSYLKALLKYLFLAILKLWEQIYAYLKICRKIYFEGKNFMELRILCKHLIADELNGKFTVGENSADTVGITLPRYYEQNDLSTFSFRITAAGKCKNATEK